MNFKKLWCFMFCGLLATVVACSSDDPVTPGNGESENSGEESSENSGDNKGSGTANYATLSSKASKDSADKIYNSWHGYHYVSMSDESKYYASIAKDFKEVFPSASPVGRIVWATQTGYYKTKCQVTGTTQKNMTYRGCTVSEGIGYGMVLSYFKGDTETFNALWNYSKGFRAYFNTPFTPWITYNFHFNQIDNSSATDADLDIATSLILMYYKTQKKEYLNDAKTIINAMWKQEVKNNMLLSGNTSMWTTNPTYNLSYFSPVALRLFAKVDESHNWTAVLDEMYKYMKKVQDNGTGVFPDWSDGSGVAKKAPNGSADDTYFLFDKESVRIPWRIAWDYYWYQDSRAKAILDKLNEFIVKKSNGNPENVSALGKSYSWDKSKSDKADGGTIPTQWLGAWCATGISGNMTWLDACTKAVNSKMPSNNNSSYFSDILLTMYAQLLNGKFVRPF